MERVETTPSPGPSREWRGEPASGTKSLPLPLAPAQRWSGDQSR